MASGFKEKFSFIEDFFESRYTVAALLIIFFICVGIIFWVLTSEDQHEREGDRLMTDAKYEEALKNYHLSLKSFHFFKETTARINLKIARAYGSSGDKVRKMDFLFQILKEYPDTVIAEKAKNILQSDFVLTDGPRFTSGPGARTELGKKREKFRIHYLKIVGLLKKNTSGVPAELVQAYEQYKEAYAAYQLKLSSSYSEAVEKEQQAREQKLQELSDN